MLIRLTPFKKNKINSIKQGGLHGISVLLGLAIGMLAAACAGISFPYKYYGLSAATYQNGKLLGPTSSDDMDLSACAPTSGNVNPCIVMLSKEFLPMKQDYKDTKNSLITCQKKCL